MAVVTYTSSDVSAGVAAKGLRVGIVAVSATYNASASLTAGDVIQMIKVPQGAAVVGLIIGGLGTGFSVTVGDGISTSRYNTGYAIAAANSGINATGYVPYVYSVDDTIDLVASASATMSGSFTIYLTALLSMDV